jgi:hypothetical protein
MGNPGSVVGRIGSLESDVRQLHEAVLKEIQERKAADAARDQDLRQLADLLSDNNEAGSYATKYLNDVDAQYTAKEAMMQDAIREFNDFLKLPEESNNYLAIWDAAFSILSTVVPALRLTQTFSKMVKMANIEMEASRIFMVTPRLMARMTIASAKGHDIADVIRKSNDIRSKIGHLSSLSAAPAPSDSSKSRVRQLIQESNKAHQALDDALDALDAEFNARIHSLLYRVPYISKKGTLLDMAKRLLPALPYYFTDEDLENLGQQYKWEILKIWAKTNVTVVFLKYPSLSIDTVTIEGLNKTQQDQIIKWFGIYAPRGKHFATPLVLTIYYALDYWGVPEVTRYQPLNSIRAS